MHIALVTRGFEIPDRAREDLEARIAELGELGLGIAEAAVSMEQNRHQYTAEITLFGRRISFHAETNVEAGSLSQAIDMILTKAEKQIRRHKERVRDARRRARTQEPMPDMVAGPDLDDEPGVEMDSSIETTDYTQEASPVTIVPEPGLFESTPLSVKEAAHQLELSDDAFLVFRNAETRELNVVRKRSDGAVGWVDP